MAQIQDRKSNFYSQKQSIRDESGAPQHLESAGDNLIKELAKKQTKTSTTLKEQLEIVQNFEKGFELSPESRKGIVNLEDFKRDDNDGEHSSSSDAKAIEANDIDTLMRKTGLTRHELELILCEKPNSTLTQLYKFAIANKKQDNKNVSLENKLPEHPINHLKEIEEECFGHLKREKCELKSDTFTNEEKTEVKKKKKSGVKKRRKRRKKQSVEDKLIDSCASRGGEPSKEEESEESGSEDERNLEEHKRPSLWDVKDMKKWAEGRPHGCKPQTFYTIVDGKIVKLDKKPESLTSNIN